MPPLSPLPPAPRPRTPLAAAARVAGLTVMGAVLMAGCGGGGGGGFFWPPPPPAPAPAPERGALVGTPAQVSSLSASEFSAALQATPTGQGLAQVAGPPLCGVQTHAITYHTVGGQEEATEGTGAVLVPTGTDPACTGERPVLLYAHGTTPARDYDLARWTDSVQAAAGEGTMVAAMFAAQGYIVVAPNYAGYAGSTLDYHPYLNGTQQGRDMVDALAAARSALPLGGANDSGALVVSGYSQGGYVALAAHRELQAQGQAVVASAPLSAPSAISLLVDYSFQGWPALGATLFVPLLSTSWQKQFGDVYDSPEDIYESQYAQGIETLLPSLTPLAELFSTGKLPPAHLYPAGAIPGPVAPELGVFYGANNLVRQSSLTAMANDILSAPCPGNALPADAASLAHATPLDCRPAQGLRRAAVANDLRNWLPQRPVLFCGGANDPTVNFLSTQATAGYFTTQGMPAGMLGVLDLEEASPGAGDPFAAARAGFAQAKQQLADATDGDAAVKAEAVLRAYHGALVPPFCLASARGFFAGVLGSGG